MDESLYTELMGPAITSIKNACISKKGVILTLCAGILCGLAARNAWASQSTTTTLVLTSGGNVVTSVPVKTAITLTAVVSAAGKSLTNGQVEFCDADAAHCINPYMVGLAQLTSNGVATYTFIPGPGPHRYNAVFLGTNAYSSSVSSAMPLTVSAGSAGTKTTSTALSYGGSQGDYTLTATVPAGSIASPTGTMSFQDTSNANYVLATAPLSITGSSGISFLNSYNYLTAADPTSGASESNLAEADFNGDGIPDLAVSTEESQRLSILLGKGDGTFTNTFIDTGLDSPGAVVAADFNADGKVDLAVSSGSAKGIEIFLGNGDGTFMPPQLISLVSYGFLASGDLNGDGIMDLVCPTDSVTNGVSTSALTILLGNGDGTFRISPGSYTVSSAPFALTLGDFNGDGKLDVAVASSFNTADSGVIAVLLGNGDGTFGPATTVGTGAAFLGLAEGDINGDGKLDLVAVNDSFVPITVLTGNGDGTFNQLAPDPSLVFLAYTLSLADFNGDGILDVAVSDADSGNVYVLLGKGDGTFAIDQSSPTTPAFIGISIATGDFNGDGQTDMAVSFYDNNQPDINDDQVKVWLAQGPGTSISTVSGISPVGTGIHYVDAVYPGDSDYSGSVSNSVPLLAQQVATTITLTAPGSSVTGQPVILTATLQPSDAQNHPASGTVTFTQGATKLGTATLSAGVATLATSSLLVGTDNISCKYSGDTNFSAAVCNHLQVIIANPPPPDFTLTGPSSVTARTESIAAGPLTLTSSNNFQGTVSLACKLPLPTTYACMISPASVTLTVGGTGSATVTLSPTIKPAAHDGGSRMVIASLVPLTLLSLAGFSRRRRSRLARLLSLAMLAILAASTTACGNDIAYPATPPGSYPFTVTASGTTEGGTAPVTHTLNITLVITP